MLPIFQDYENRIQSLQEQVERHSMISSVATTNFFDDEEEEEEGNLSLCLLFTFAQPCCSNIGLKIDEYKHVTLDLY